MKDTKEEKVVLYIIQGYDQVEFSGVTKEEIINYMKKEGESPIQSSVDVHFENDQRTFYRINDFLKRGWAKEVEVEVNEKDIFDRFFEEEKKYYASSPEGILGAECSAEGWTKFEIGKLKYQWV